MLRIQYYTEADKIDLIENFYPAPEYTLYEEQAHADGKFLIFYEPGEIVPRRVYADAIEIGSDTFIETIKSKTPNQVETFVVNKLTSGEYTIIQAIGKIFKILTYILRNK